MIKLVWKFQSPTSKLTLITDQKLTRIHARQQAEWEWIDRQLSEHFQQESHKAPSHSPKIDS